MSTSNIISDNIAIINIINEFSTTDPNKPYQKTYKSLENLFERFKTQEDNVNNAFEEKQLLTPESIAKIFNINFNSFSKQIKFFLDFEKELKLLIEVDLNECNQIYTKIINEYNNFKQFIKDIFDNDKFKNIVIDNVKKTHGKIHSRLVKINDFIVDFNDYTEEKYSLDLGKYFEYENLMSLNNKYFSNSNKVQNDIIYCIQSLKSMFEKQQTKDELPVINTYLENIKETPVELKSKIDLHFSEIIKYKKELTEKVNSIDFNAIHKKFEALTDNINTDLYIKSFSRDLKSNLLSDSKFVINIFKNTTDYFNRIFNNFKNSEFNKEGLLLYENQNLINGYRSTLVQLIGTIQKLKSHGVVKTVYENINKLIDIYQNIKNSLDSENENTFLEYYKDINYLDIETEHKNNLEKLKNLEQQVKNLEENNNLVESVILEINLKKIMNNIFDKITPESIKVDRTIKQLNAEWEEADRLAKEEARRIKKFERLKRFKKRSEVGKPTDFRMLKLYKERSKKYLFYIYLTQLKIIEDTRFTLKKIHSEWKKLIGKFKRFKKNIFKEEDYYYIETRIADLRSGLNKLFKKIRFDGIFDNRNIYSFNEWSKDLYESLLNYKKEFKSKSEEIKNILEDRDYLSKQINIDLVKSFKEKYYNLLINLIQHLNEIKKLIEDNEQKFNRQDKKLSKINIALKSPEYLESNYLAHDKKLMIHNRLLNIVNSSKLYVLKLFSLIDNTILNLIKNIDIFKFGVNDLQALVDENKEREKIIKQIQDDLSSDNEFTFFLDEIDRKLNNPVEADKEFIEAANEVLRKEIISDNQPYGSVEDLEVSLLELEKELIKHQDERLNQIQQLNIFRNEQAAE